jgi:hypothetical protein
MPGQIATYIRSIFMRVLSPDISRLLTAAPTQIVFLFHAVPSGPEKGLLQRGGSYCFGAKMNIHVWPCFMYADFHLSGKSGKHLISTARTNLES